MRILVDVVHTGGVEAGRAAFDAVHSVAFFKQEFGEVRAVLASDTSNKGDFGLHWSSTHAFVSSKNLDTPVPSRLAGLL